MAACLVLPLVVLLAFFGAFAFAALAVVFLFATLPIRKDPPSSLVAPSFQPIALLSIDSSRAPPVL